jgi:hypothetical protein
MTNDERIRYEKKINYYTSVVYNIIALFYVCLSGFSVDAAQKYIWVPPVCLISSYYYLWLAY